MRRRSASSRASARRHGWSPPCASPSSIGPLVPALRGRDEQLDVRRAGGRVEREQPQRPVLVHRDLLAAGAQRREALAQLGREGRVEHVQELLFGAEVDREPAHLLGRQRRRAVAEDRHVRVTEAVDRLELVADREQVVALERPQDPELDRVRVLELVDHDQLEALRPALPRLRVGQQALRAQLEVVEVDRRPLGLRGVVGGAEALQEGIQELEGAAGVEVRAGGPVRAPGGAVGLAGLGLQRLRAVLQLGGVERARPRHSLSPRTSPHASRAVRAAVTRAPAPARKRSCSAASRARARGARVRHRARRRDRQPRALVAARPQRRVGIEDQLAQGRAVGRGEVDRRGPLGAGPALQRALVGRTGQPLGRGRFQDLEARVQPGGQRLRAQQAGAEAVDRADPGAVDRAGVLVLPQLGQAAAQALGELARGLLGEGQGEDRAHRHLVLADGGGDPLDHHRGLARAGVGGEQRGPRAGVDRGALLGREARHPARQIPGWAQPPLYAQRSGQGSMRPARRSAAALAATSRAPSRRSSSVSSSLTSPLT